MIITKSWVQNRIHSLPPEKLIHFIGRALLVLLENQTAEEQNTGTVSENNGIGFCAYEAEIGTSIAKYYLYKKKLTEKQVAFWTEEKDGYARICKYYRQLNKAATEKKDGHD